MTKFISPQPDAAHSGAAPSPGPTISELVDRYNLQDRFDALLSPFRNPATRETIRQLAKGTSFPTRLGLELETKGVAAGRLVSGLIDLLGPVRALSLEPIAQVEAPPASVEHATVVAEEQPASPPPDAGGGEGIPPAKPPNTRRPTPGGLTVAKLADALQLPEEFLIASGLSDMHYDSRPAVKVSYRNELGKEVGARFLFTLDGEGRWKNGTKPSPYGLWKLSEARAQGHLALVGCESDCLALWDQGVPALGLPDVNAEPDRWTAQLTDILTIYVPVPSEGEQRAEPPDWIKGSVLRDRIRLVQLPGGCARVVDLQWDRAILRELWEKLIASAIPYADALEALKPEEIARAFELAQPLLDDPHVLDRISEVVSARGYAGDTKPVRLVYIALTSRFLERPINVVLRAQAGSGKNRAVNAVLELMPDQAYYMVSAASPLMLVYCPESFKNRIVVYAEADSIPNEGAAASVIRSIAADNKTIYEVVCDNPKTGRKETQRIIKEGPTGLVTTTTESLPHQLRTRVLEIAIADSTMQVERVMDAHARRAMGATDSLPDVAPFCALQVWLALGGEHRVFVPFAAALSCSIVARQVRLNRDFPQLLSCIQALALLRQRHRQRTDDGRIVATIEGYYADARTLLGDVFDVIAADGVTPAVRRTVEAVPDTGNGISQTELAVIMNLSTSVVSERVHDAAAGGWIVNEEQQRGRAAKWKRLATPPAHITALPTVELVRTVFGCSASLPGLGVPPSPGLSPTRIRRILRHHAVKREHPQACAVLELAAKVHRQAEPVLLKDALVPLADAGVSDGEARALIDSLDSCAWSVVDQRRQDGPDVKVLVPVPESEEA